MKIFEKTIAKLKALNKTLNTAFNFVLVFLVYWVGVSLSFIFLKASKIRKKKIEVSTYWIDFKRDLEDYNRQY